MTDPLTSRTDSEPTVYLPAEVEHPSVNAYANYDCRCVACKKLWRDYQLPRFKTRRAKSLTDPDDERHGTYSGYANYGCRCPKCRDANRVYGVGYKYKHGRITLERAKQLGWNEEMEKK